MHFSRLDGDSGQVLWYRRQAEVFRKKLVHDRPLRRTEVVRLVGQVNALQLVRRGVVAIDRLDQRLDRGREVMRRVRIGLACPQQPATDAESIGDAARDQAGELHDRRGRRLQHRHPRFAIAAVVPATPGIDDHQRCGGRDTVVQESQINRLRPTAGCARDPDPGRVDILLSDQEVDRPETVGKSARPAPGDGRDQLAGSRSSRPCCTTTRPPPCGSGGHSGSADPSDIARPRSGRADREPLGATSQQPADDIDCRSRKNRETFPASHSRSCNRRGAAGCGPPQRGAACSSLQADRRGNGTVAATRHAASPTLRSCGGSPPLSAY